MVHKNKFNYNMQSKLDVSISKIKFGIATEHYLIAIKLCKY
jgi:hypothetical protein